jgi:MSHA pilin protein MshC
MRVTMHRSAKGFSLVELIVTLLVVGILAVTVAPRMFAIQGFDARGFYDETMSILRYAQKTAIAQRRTVCVAFAINSATLTIASAPSVTTCDTNLTGPNGVAPYSVTARNNVTYSAIPTSFNFDARGRPIDAAGSLVNILPIQVSGNTNTITIEAETGYVHQ